MISLRKFVALFVIKKVALFLLLLLLPSLNAEDGDSLGDIQAGVCELQNVVNGLLAAIVFILVVLAAVVYAGSQMAGAETRARGSVWATSMLVGALLGIIIYAAVPIILGAMLNQDIRDACSDYTAGGYYTPGGPGTGLTGGLGGGGGGGTMEGPVLVINGGSAPPGVGGGGIGVPPPTGDTGGGGIEGGIIPPRPPPPPPEPPIGPSMPLR